MSFEILQYLPAFLVSSLLGLIITPIVIAIYKNFGWLDNPSNQNHPKVIHTQVVPRGGGLVIFLAIFLATLFFLPLDKYILGILVGGGILALVGVLDDIFDIHPKFRLGAGLLAALVVIGVGIGIPYITNPLGENLIYLNQPQIPIFLFGKERTIWILADIFACIWILGLMNFVNWSKGLDGQLPGMVVIAALTITQLSTNFSADITQWETGLLAVIVAGAYLGFLPWNIFPQKIMPGYGGGSLAGYFLAVLAILSTTKVGTLMVVLGIPLIDAIFVLLRRIYAGKNPVWGDTRHLHHALLGWGLSKKQVAIFYWLITALLGFVALNVNSKQKLYTLLLIGLGIGSFVILTKWRNKN